MATHTTNTRNTLVTVAPDTRAVAAAAPPTGRGTVAERQYAMLHGHDYELTSDDVTYAVHRDRGGDGDREAFFAVGRGCMRTSPLAKSYGWGIHSDDAGRLALVAVDSPRYAQLMADDAVTKTPAMRSSRAR